MKTNIMAPENLLEKLKNKLTKERKLAFFTALIFGLIIHFQLYSQELTNPDGVWNMGYSISGAWEASLGRWGIIFFDILRGGLVSPIVSTFISIIIMSIVAVLIIDLFKINNNIAIFCISIAMVSMPTLTTTLTYWYCSDSYTFAILLSVLAVYFIHRSKTIKKKNIFWGSISLALSLSLYQSVIGVTVTLCVMMFIYDILVNTKTTKEILIEILNAIIMGILGAIIYFILSQIALKLYGTTLAEYSGANEIRFKKFA